MAISAEEVAREGDRRDVLKGYVDARLVNLFTLPV